MENLVPLGTGNSRFMKSNISPNTTLAQLIQMLNNGTFPYDVGTINPAGISQQGTPLNKATLLKDETAALYGLGTDAVPDDVLALLSKSALYKTVTPTAQLGTLDEGTIIYLNENGSPVPFYVAKQGYEPSYNTDRVLVVRKDAIQTGAWNSTNVNTYSGSTIDTWLNSTYLNTLDSDVKTAIGTTNIPYTPMSGDTSVKRINKSVFQLSVTELGKSASHANIEGTQIPTASLILSGGKATWTRTSYDTSTTLVYVVAPAGNLSYDNANVDTNYYQPSFTLPKTFVVSLGSPTSGLYDLSNNLLLKLPGVNIETGSYTGTGTYGQGNPNTLTFGFEPKLVVVLFNVYTTAPYQRTKLGIFTKNYGVSLAGNSQFQSYYIISEISGNSLSWYSNGYQSSAGNQLNDAGLIFDYIAIG